MLPIVIFESLIKQAIECDGRGLGKYGTYGKCHAHPSVHLQGASYHVHRVPRHPYSLRFRPLQNLQLKMA